MTLASHAKQTDSYALGLRAACEGRPADAIMAFECALKERPEDIRVMFALANTAAAIGHAEAAELFYRRVLAQEPGRIEALVNLANLLRSHGRIGDAIALIKPAVERQPEAADLWLTLGSALREAGDARLAETFYREALRLCPGNAPALGNLADLLSDQGQSDEALGLYEEAIRLDSENAQARLNRAILLFLKGRLGEGWSDYEYRLRIKGRALQADHDLPLWNGQPQDGMRLLVTTEQGVGDQIMFASLIPELLRTCQDKKGHLVLEAEPRLVPLFARSFAGASVRAARLEQRGGQKFLHYDWLAACGGADAAIALGSLPRVLRGTLADFPTPHAFLKTDERERVNWIAWLQEQKALSPIGLCWRSGSVGGLRGLQYAPLEAWAEFIRRIPGTPVSLQYDVTGEEIEALEQMSGREILVPPKLDQKQEIDRTAAMISALDYVVSAPTSVSWISAALGVPTLKILYNTSWTGFGCGYEPFAPAALCITPKESGNWQDAFAKADAKINDMRRAV